MHFMRCDDDLNEREELSFYASQAKAGNMMSILKQAV